MFMALDEFPHQLVAFSSCFSFSSIHNLFFNSVLKVVLWFRKLFYTADTLELTFWRMSVFEQCLHSIIAFLNVVESSLTFYNINHWVPRLHARTIGSKKLFYMRKFSISYFKYYFTSTIKKISLKMREKRKLMKNLPIRFMSFGSHHKSCATSLTISTESLTGGR
jgi:uncharacterized membrane protein